MAVSITIGLFILSLYMVLAVSRTSRQCKGDCSKVICTNRKQLAKVCRSGTVYGPCGCCQVCAKSKGELCSNSAGSHRKCGPGLVCYSPKKSVDAVGLCQGMY